MSNILVASLPLCFTMTYGNKSFGLCFMMDCNVHFCQSDLHMLAICGILGTHEDTSDWFHFWKAEIKNTPTCTPLPNSTQPHSAAKALKRPDRIATRPAQVDKCDHVSLKTHAARKKRKIGAGANSSRKFWIWPPNWTDERQNHTYA